MAKQNLEKGFFVVFHFGSRSCDHTTNDVELESRWDQPWLPDGFPRTSVQAEAL